MVEQVRVKWLAKPNFTGAGPLFGCYYTSGVSKPVPRLMVQARVKAMRHAFHLLCAECQEPEDYAKPLAEQPHKATCTRYVAPKAEPALDAAPAAAPPPTAQSTDVAPTAVPVMAFPTGNRAGKGRRF